MGVRNSNLEIRPTLSNLQFYIGQTGKPEHNPLLDFSEMYKGAELGIKFTLSGLDRVKNPYTDNNEIYLIILLYDKTGDIGFELKNLWSLYLNKDTMRKKYEHIQFTLYKFEPNNKGYDFANIYQELKVIAAPVEFQENDIDKDTMMDWMSKTQLNEVFSTKIPIYSNEVFENE